MGILTIIFMVIPFVGKATAALGGAAAAAIARIGLTISEAGNAALTIAGIVDDPSSAPLAIAGLLIRAGAAGLSTRKIFKEAADARRGISASTLKLLSPSFQRKDGIVQNIVRKCAA